MDKKKTLVILIYSEKKKKVKNMSKYISSQK